MTKKINTKKLEKGLMPSKSSMKKKNGKKNSNY